MFNNLIESSSHAKEFKRRGSFLLFTTATYVVLFVITGVVSIYAYDAHLESQSTELEIIALCRCVPEPAPQRSTRIRFVRRRTQTGTPTQSTRTVLIDSVSNPNNVPDEPRNHASPCATCAPRFRARAMSTPIRPRHQASDRGVPEAQATTPVVNIPEPPPPPPPAPTPVVPKVLRISQVY